MRMKKSSSSSSLPKQQGRRNRSRSSSSNYRTNSMTSRGQSPRPTNPNNTLRRSNSGRSSHRRNNNTLTRPQHEKPKSISKHKLHMPHIIPNISPSVLLKKHHSSTSTNNNNHGRSKSQDKNTNSEDGGGGYHSRSTSRRRRRGRSSTPKHRQHEHQQQPSSSSLTQSFSNTLRRSLSSGGNRNNQNHHRNTSRGGSNTNINNNGRGRRSRSTNSTTQSSTTTTFRRLRSFSTGDRGRNTNTNNSRRSRSVSSSFQSRHRHHQQHQSNTEDHTDRSSSSNERNRIRSISTGRRRGRGMNNNTTAKQSWMPDRSSRGGGDHNHNHHSYKRKRGKSMPARIFNSMTFWKNGGGGDGDDDDPKNSTNHHHIHNHRCTTSDEKKQHKQKNSNLESSVPELDKELKRFSSSTHRGGSSSSKERGKKGVVNEWGMKPTRGRSRPKHTRHRSSSQLKELEAEVASLNHPQQPPPPPPPTTSHSRHHPPPPPPPPFHGGQPHPHTTKQQQHNHGNYHRSKSLPRDFQRYTLLDVMVQMEKEIEVPSKYYSNDNGGGSRTNAELDSVISPIASLDSSWRYKEDMLLMKSMASLSEARRGRGRGGSGAGGVPTSSTRMRSSGMVDEGYDPMKSHAIRKQPQPQPPQSSGSSRFPPPPPLPPPVTQLGDINDIDGDEEEEEDISNFNDIDGGEDEEEDDDTRVEEEDEGEPSQDKSENDGETNDTNSDEENKDELTASNEEDKTEISESYRTNDDFTFRSSIIRPEPISSVYGGNSATEPPTTNTNTVEKTKMKESPIRDADSSRSGRSSSRCTSSSSGGEGDSLIGYASVASDEKVASIAPPSHSSIRKNKPGAIAAGASPHFQGDRSAAHSMGTLSRMHNDLQRKMTELQGDLDEHGRPLREFDVTSIDSSTGQVSDLTLPTVLMKAPPPSSRIRAMKPKPLTTRRTKAGTLELQGDIDAMKSLAVSELSMASPVQSAFPKNVSHRLSSYKKTVNTTSGSAPPPPRRTAAPVQLRRQSNTHPKQKISPIVESSEEHVHMFKKKSSDRSFHSRQSHGTASSAGNTSQMPMKPASGAGHRHAPPPPKHRPSGTKIDIGEVAQQLQVMQGQGVGAGSVGSGYGSRSRQHNMPKAGGSNSVSSVTHSSVEGMVWSDKFGKSGRYSGDVNAHYVPNGMGSMQYDFGLTVEGRWVDGTLLSNDLNEGFAV